MMRVDPNNLPEYMEECITEDHNDCGLFIDRDTGHIIMMEDFLNTTKANHKVINWDAFKKHYIMISKDF